MTRVTPKQNLNTNGSASLNEVSISRVKDIATIELPNATLEINYSVHEDGVHNASSISENTTAIFLEATGNWTSVNDAYSFYLNSSDYGPVLKKAMTYGIPLVEANPDLREDLFSSDRTALIGRSAFGALAAGGAVALAKMKDPLPQNRRKFLSLSAALGALSAYSLFPAVALGSRSVASANNVAHDVSASLMSASEKLWPPYYEHILRFRNAVIAYKELNCLEFGILAKPNIRTRYVTLLGACHCGIEADLMSPKSQLYDYLESFGARLKEIVKTPETFYSIHISRVNQKKEKIVIPELRQLLESK